MDAELAATAARVTASSPSASASAAAAATTVSGVESGARHQASGRWPGERLVDRRDRVAHDRAVADDHHRRLERAHRLRRGEDLLAVQRRGAASGKRQPKWSDVSRARSVVNVSPAITARSRVSRNATWPGRVARGRDDLEAADAVARAAGAGRRACATFGQLPGNLPSRPSPPRGCGRRARASAPRRRRRGCRAARPASRRGRRARA